MDLAEFKTILTENDSFDIVEKCYFNIPSANLTEVQKAYIEKRVIESLSLKTGSVRIVPVGSAHLGFSLVDKTRIDPSKIRYRPFMPDSDYDLAIISDSLFDKIWYELSEYSLKYTWFPWRSCKLGDYLVCGWIRPDKFPKNVRLYWGDTLWDTLHALTKTVGENSHKVRCGLFREEMVLKKYLERSIIDCQKMEGIL